MVFCSAGGLAAPRPQRGRSLRHPPGIDAVFRTLATRRDTLDGRGIGERGFTTKAQRSHKGPQRRQRTEVRKRMEVVLHGSLLNSDSSVFFVALRVIFVPSW